MVLVEEWMVLPKELPSCVVEVQKQEKPEGLAFFDVCSFNGFPNESSKFIHHQVEVVLRQFKFQSGRKDGPRFANSRFIGLRDPKNAS